MSDPQWCAIRRTWCHCKPRCDDYDNAPDGFDGIYRCTKHPEREVVAPIACRRCAQCAEDVMNNYANAMVKRDQLERPAQALEQEYNGYGELIDERQVRKRRQDI